MKTSVPITFVALFYDSDYPWNSCMITKNFAVLNRYISKNTSSIELAHIRDQNGTDIRSEKYEIQEHFI